MNTESALKQQKAEHKAMKRLKAIFNGKLSKRNRPVLHGWNPNRPMSETRLNY